MTDPNGTTETDPPVPASTAAAAAPTVSAPVEGPPTESKLDTEPGARKPRDARIIHLILASMGVSAYQERVPLMLLDFAYRYTSSVLQDALLFSDAINGTANTGGPNPPSIITIPDVRMSVASRITHQFNTALPKEFLLDVAQERNRIALPTVTKEFGVRLPPEKYSLTGINWDLAETREDWMDDSSGGEEEEYAAVPKLGLGGGGEGMDVDDLFAEEEVDSSMPDA